MSLESNHFEYSAKGWGNINMQRLAILGASGHGKVIADAAICAGWKDIVFFDDAWVKITHILDWRVVGRSENLIKDAHNFDGVVIAIGNNEIRQDKSKQLADAGISLFSTIIHPAACISRYATIGQGSVILAGAVLNPNCHVGASCIVNTNATIEHDCVLGDGVHISPNVGLGGHVAVGDLSWIGIGASVRQQITIGSQVMVGAGAAVVSNIPDYATAVGVPARIIKIREG